LHSNALMLSIIKLLNPPPQKKLISMLCTSRATVDYWFDNIDMNYVTSFYTVRCRHQQCSPNYTPRINWVFNVIHICLLSRCLLNSGFPTNFSMHSSSAPYVPVCFAHLFPFDLIISVKRRKTHLQHSTVQCHCDTSRKVASSIPDGFIAIFHWHNPSGRTMALESTHSLAEMSARNISWGWRQPVRVVDNLTIFICRLSWNLGASTSWNPQGLSRPVMGLLYLYSTVQYSTVLYVLSDHEPVCSGIRAQGMALQPV